MESLLRNNYTAHYGLPVCVEPNLVIRTSDTYFEIEDTVAREITLHFINGYGMARFSNPRALTITIANYDKFVTSLPIQFQTGRKRCDIIVCDNGENLILGEIKDSPNIKGHRRTAKKQLYESLTTLIDVPQFLALSNNKTKKRCCYFNKQTSSPATLNATTAFNRLSFIFQDGFQMSHSAIEALDFEFWEYLSGHTLTLT